jgi:hypothetical protein
MPGMDWEEWISTPPVNYPQPTPAPAAPKTTPVTPVARGWDPALGASQLG